MSWSEIDWKALDRLRQQFLSGVPSGSYWSSESDLDSYDRTFGERIGWKWDAVLDELAAKGWNPPPGDILDWGCGSGVAGRRLVGRFGTKGFGTLILWDQSPLASSFAESRAVAQFEGLSCSTATESFLKGNDPIGVLVISHVLNELTSAAFEQVRGLALRSRAVLWVEPGSREISRRLGAFRDEFSDRFRIVAPCTHNLKCPALLPENERHWCHHFAQPPSAIFSDSDWVRFGKRMGIDLRSLPYAFVALDRNQTSEIQGFSRVIGRPEAFKPYVRLLSCDAKGLAELEIPKRTNAALCKELERSRKPLIYKWQRNENVVLSGSSAVRHGAVVSPGGDAGPHTPQ